MQRFALPAHPRCLLASVLTSQSAERPGGAVDVQKPQVLAQLVWWAGSAPHCPVMATTAQLTPTAESTQARARSGESASATYRSASSARRRRRWRGAMACVRACAAA